MMNNTCMNLATMDTDNYAFFKDFSDKYQEELSDNSRGYHVSIENFAMYLAKENLWTAFQKDLEEILKNQTTLEYVAVDYEIPVVMVKYFINMF